jgi:flagellar FliL protein
VALDAMRQMTEADLVKPEFRKELAAKIREEMNAVLQKYEDFGGIEEVFFTSFVVQ